MKNKIMKNKISLTGAVKVFGWVATAVGGILVAWATDQQTKKQVDEKLEEYISKTGEES